MVADGHNLVWQEFCGYGRVPVYEFWLPTDLQETIAAWLEGHWLQKLKPWEWENLRSDEPVYRRGDLAFGFNLNRSSISPDYHTSVITAGNCNRLIQASKALTWPLDRGSESLYSSFADALAMWALSANSRWNDCAIELIQNDGKTPSDLITCREDVYFYLKAHGFMDKDAFKGMNFVRKGRGFPVVTEEMQTAPDHWVLRQGEGVMLLYSKAHLLSRLFFHLKAGRFQVSDRTRD